MRIVAVDLESTGLTGIMGRVLCASFAPIAAENGRVKTFRAEEYATDDPIDDGPLAAAIRDELEDYNLWVTWNGKMFDMPFLQARLLKAGLRPLEPRMHLDLMYYARGVTMRIGSSKLVNVQKFLGLDEAKTDISWEDWQRAGMGDEKAMEEVVTHCEQDVKVLREAYWKMIPLVRHVHR